MLEILIMIACVGGLAARARQRRVSPLGVIFAAAGGWVLLWFATGTALGLWAFPLRWLWLGAVYLFVEYGAHRGKKAASTWQCPECTMFNDAGTLVCHCGYENPETA